MAALAILATARRLAMCFSTRCHPKQTLRNRAMTAAGADRRLIAIGATSEVKINLLPVRHIKIKLTAAIVQRGSRLLWI